MVLTAFSTARSLQSWTPWCYRLCPDIWDYLVKNKCHISDCNLPGNGKKCINGATYYLEFNFTVTSHKILTGLHLRLYCSVNTRSTKKRERNVKLSSSSGGGSDWQPSESGGFRWMRAWVRPRHRATSVRLPGPCGKMTRLCCSHDKDKLHPLENISRFLFTPTFSPSPHLFLYATGCSPNVCHTKRRWWGGCSLSKYIRG